MLRARLADHLGALRMANSSLMVCVQALQRQNAEMDVDIARVLQRQVSDPLDAATEGLEALSLVRDQGSLMNFLCRFRGVERL